MNNDRTFWICAVLFLGLAIVGMVRKDDDKINKLLIVSIMLVLAVVIKLLMKVWS